MASNFPHCDSANHHAADTAAGTDRSHKILIEFQAWAISELCVMRAVMDQTQIAIDDSRRVLAGFPAMPSGDTFRRSTAKPAERDRQHCEHMGSDGNRNGLLCLAM